MSLQVVAGEDLPSVDRFADEPFVRRVEKVAVVFRFMTLEIERWIWNTSTILVHIVSENGR